MKRVCRGCGREIVFATGPKGRIPLEKVSSLYTIKWGTTDWLANLVEAADGSDLYVSHQSVCPNAKEFEKKPDAPRSDEFPFPMG